MSTVLQNVNLYLPEFRKKKHWLDAEKMLLVAGAGLLLLAVVSGVEYWQLAQLRGELAATEQQQRAAAADTATLLAQYGVQTEDPVLLDNIRELEADLQSKEALLQFLEGRELGNAQGFSEHLSDLSRYHVQGLSLGRISLSEGGRSVELSGQVLKADLVLLFLQNLAKGRTYAGTQFEMFTLQDEPAASAATDAANALAVWDFQVRSLQTQR